MYFIFGVCNNFYFPPPATPFQIFFSLITLINVLLKSSHFQSRKKVSIRWHKPYKISSGFMRGWRVGLLKELFEIQKISLFSINECIVIPVKYIHGTIISFINQFLNQYFIITFRSVRALFAYTKSRSTLKN